MKLQIKNSTNTKIKCELIGEFDAVGCREIRNTLEALLDDHGDKEIEFDLENVSFMDSSGIGALVFLLKRLRTQGGAIRLVNVSGQPKELIILLRVDQAIPVTWASNAA